MALKMKAACETCKTALPETSGKAHICSYERTYCTSCAKASGGRCPKCRGELLPRPKRKK